MSLRTRLLDWLCPRTESVPVPAPSPDPFPPPDPTEWELFSIDRPDDMVSMHPDMRVVTLRRPDGAVPEYRQFAGRECYWRTWSRMEPYHGFSPILTHWFQMRKRHLADGGTLPDIEAEARFWADLVRGGPAGAPHPGGEKSTYAYD